MARSVYIYALRDPVTREYRYVGASMDPERRLESHVSASHGWTHRTPVCDWIQLLEKGGLLPELAILRRRCRRPEDDELLWMARLYRGQLFNRPRDVRRGMELHVKRRHRRWSEEKQTQCVDRWCDKVRRACPADATVDRSGIVVPRVALHDMDDLWLKWWLSVEDGLEYLVPENRNQRRSSRVRFPIAPMPFEKRGTWPFFGRHALIDNRRPTLIDHAGVRSCLLRDVASQVFERMNNGFLEFWESLKSSD